MAFEPWHGFTFVNMTNCWHWVEACYLAGQPCANGCKKRDGTLSESVV